MHVGLAESNSPGTCRTHSLPFCACSFPFHFIEALPLLEGFSACPTIPVAGSASSSSGGHRAQRGSPPGCRQRCCQQCSYTTQCPSKLKRHQRIHTGERPFQCSHCGKAFIEKGNLVTHLRVHTGERPFLCHLCPSAFTQVNALVGHVRSHTGERPFHCRFCPEAFKHRRQKKAHEQKAHNHHK
ncbi:uncharacterized protein LOC144179200 [Haemaphysalis longicornis]